MYRKQAAANAGHVTKVARRGREFLLGDLDFVNEPPAQRDRQSDGHSA
jgi:hypothetical protein